VDMLSQPFQEHSGDVPLALLVRLSCTLVGMAPLSNLFFLV